MPVGNPALYFLLHNMEWLTENTWIISDTHFFHKNIIAHADRPIYHNEMMISNWIQRISPKDNVLHLGDVTLGPKRRVRLLKELLPGNKYLVNGNHDSRRTMRKLLDFNIFPERDKPLFKKFRGFLLIFSHVPIYKIKHPLTYNLHGHIHQHKSPTANHINMCVEVRGYKPWRLSEILDEIEEKS